MDYKTDEEKMKVALDQANLAFNKNEVPVGAAIFDIKNNLMVTPGLQATRRSLY